MPGASVLHRARVVRRSVQVAERHKVEAVVRHRGLVVLPPGIRIVAGRSFPGVARSLQMARPKPARRLSRVDKLVPVGPETLSPAPGMDLPVER